MISDPEDHLASQDACCIFCEAKASASSASSRRDAAAQLEAAGWQFCAGLAADVGEDLGIGASAVCPKCAADESKPLERICSWCEKKLQDGRRPASHGMCLDCSSRF